MKNLTSIFVPQNMHYTKLYLENLAKAPSGCLLPIIRPTSPMRIGSVIFHNERYQCITTDVIMIKIHPLLFNRNLI